MQTYGRAFAEIYNQRWTEFARRVAPRIQAFYESTRIGQTERTLLDLCCGTGQLAVHFLKHGYQVVGIDSSRPMLCLAEGNARTYVEAGHARFLQADASEFTLIERFGLVVSTFDALNHLADEKALRTCFQCVYNVCDGWFIFDLNTRRGLARWDGVSVDDRDDALIISRGIFDEVGEKAWLKITGFVHASDGLFKRFDETAFNTVFEIERVRAILLEVGWQTVHVALERDLEAAVRDPESEGRVFVVAAK